MGAGRLPWIVLLSNRRSVGRIASFLTSDHGQQAQTR